MEMRRAHRTSGPLVTILVAALAAAPALSQPTESVDVPGVFSEVIDVRVVNVEVVVTDAQGNRVTGLGRDDFRVFVDGAERPIDFWSEVRDGETQSSERRALDAEELDALEREAHSTSYLLFIDDSFVHARDRNLVLEKLANDLEGLSPRDRVAVVAFDGRELTLLSAWTSSTRVVGGALRDARARPSRRQSTRPRPPPQSSEPPRQRGQRALRSAASVRATAGQRSRAFGHGRGREPAHLLVATRTQGDAAPRRRLAAVAGRVRRPRRRHAGGTRGGVRQRRARLWSSLRTADRHREPARLHPLSSRRGRNRGPHRSRGSDGTAAGSGRPELLRARRKPARRHALPGREDRRPRRRSTTSASSPWPASPPTRARTTGSA